MAAVLWWLYRSEERPGYRRLLCRPFIDYERNSGTKGEVFSSFLLRFITYERNGERLRVKLLGLTIRESWSPATAQGGRACAKGAVHLARFFSRGYIGP